MAIFLANENAPGAAVVAARDAGHDVAWMAEISPGDSDERVLARELAEGRVLVTFDKDFGELVFRRGRAASCGIILLRPRLESPESLARFTVTVPGRNIPWAGHFTVAREGMLRSVPLA